ncbi:MAG: gliding motility-associated C-terminal domain-containing protein [Bacteroidota bacterium]
MKKKSVHLISLLSILLSLQVSAVLAQSSACTTFIRQKDTVICPGATVSLDLLDPPKRDSMLPGVWKLLIPGNAMDSNLFNIKAFGYDKVNQCLYSIIHKRIIRYDLKTNTVVSVPADNWPDDYTEFTYDYTNKRLLCWRGGRDIVYAIPDNGGSWTTIGAGAIDRECFGSSVYWNPITKQVGLYGGYGFNAVKSWIYENDGLGWLERKPNPPIDSVPPKGGNIVGVNGDGTKLYLFSGQGNYSGDELSGSCSLGSPWATSGGMFCWLRDLWELDLTTYKFTNILPVNNASIRYEGALSYYYDKSRFYIFGGFQPTGDYATNQNLVNTNKTFYFRKGIDTGFVEIQGEGQVPPAMPKTLLNNYSYYDPVGKRMIWARFDGIWAYYPDSTLVPPSFRSTVWSTGDTSSAITVKPLQTTLYRVTRAIGSQVCKDSITINVTNMQTSLQHNVNICGSTTVLDAGAGFSSYAWSSGETSQTITANQSTTYTVTVGKATCTAKDSSKVLFAIPVLDFTVGVLKDSVCAGDADSLFVVTPQTGIAYTWTVAGNTSVINTGNNYVPKNISATTNYAITASSNPAICTSKSGTARIVVRSKLPVPVVHIDSTNISSLLFSWDPVPGATGYLVSTDRGSTFTIPSTGAQGLKHGVTGLQPNKTISLAVKATGPYSCQTSDTAQTRATTLNPFGDGIFVPNVFTPNGDGVNDVLLVYGTAIASIRLIIFNQWGGQIFVSTDVSKGWDGTNKGQRSPAGLYTYALEAIMQDGKKITKGGTFNLIR